MIATFTASDLLDAFLALLPSGRAWPKTRTGTGVAQFVPPRLGSTCIVGFTPFPTFDQVNAGYTFTSKSDSLMVQTIAPYILADERLYRRAVELFIDTFPKNTVELLPEWEETLGLPDQCIGPNPNLLQRQASVVARLVGRGGQNIPYFTNLAVNLGYTDAYIQEFGPFLADIHGADQWAIMDNFYPYAWMVIAESQSSVNRILVCELQTIRPANTELYFYFYTATPNADPLIGTTYTYVPTPVVTLPGQAVDLTAQTYFTGIQLTQGEVLSQSPINTVVGQLVAQGNGDLGTPVFTLINDDIGNFKLSGTEILVARDTIASGTHTIQVHVSSPDIITAAANNYTIDITITQAVVTGSITSTIHAIIPRPVGHAVSSYTSGTVSGARTNWYENPGQDGGFWKQPFYSSAKFITPQDPTRGALITTLRNGTQGSPHGTVNAKGNYAVPWVIGKSGDPLVTVTDGSKSKQIRIPVGTIVEGPTSAVDQSIGGADSTQPYLVWSISGASINTTSVQAPDLTSTITGIYGFQIDDGSGEMMTDQTTGQPGTNNSFGLIQDIELDKANADPNYVIQHMLAMAMDPAMINNSIVWPLKAIDTSFSNTGNIPQGVTIGIPSTVSRPTGKSRGFNLLFDNLQQFGWFYYNVAGNGGVSLSAYSNKSANTALVTDLQNSISEVMGYACILDWTNGSTGAQYNTATIKGKTSGATSPYAAPPPLDYSPTGGVPILPATFDAWYDTGSHTVHYNVKSVPAAGTTNGGGGSSTSESAQGADVTTVGPQLYDALLESFSLSSDGYIIENRIKDTATSQSVIELLYYNHNLYQQNSAGNWYYKPNISATYVGPVTDPRNSG